MATAKIEIVLGLGADLRSSLEDEGMGAVERAVRSYVEDVTEDLGLPAPDVKARAETAAKGYNVAINGSPCRVPMWREGDGGPLPSPQLLASRIARTIHVNRERLVDSRIAEEFRESRFSDQARQYLQRLSRAEFLDFLRLRVRGCFRPDTSDFLSDPARPQLTQWTAEAFYEESALPLSGLRCILWQPPGAASASAADDRPIERQSEAMQENLFYQTGIRFPRVEQRWDATLGPAEFRIQINDLRLPRATGLADSELLVNVMTDVLKLPGIDKRSGVHPETGAAASIVKGGAETAKKVREAGWIAWDRGGYLVLAGTAELRTHAASYITAQSVEHDLDLLGNLHWYPDVVAGALTRFRVSTIAQVLRSLAEEGISIRHLVGVLETMLAIKSTVNADSAKHIVFYPYVTPLCPAAFGERLEDVEPTGYAECVRSQFKQFISHKYKRGQNTLVVYLLDPEIESQVAKSRKDTLTDQKKSAILSAVEKEIGGLPSGSAPVILTTVEVRRTFRRLIEMEFPEVAVLAYQELSPDLNIQPIARISLR